VPLLRVLIFLLLPMAAAAQSTDVTLGTINADPTEPVEISADSLQVDQDSGRAVFSGNVVVGQGDLRLAATRIEVIYQSESGDISRLEASGGVTFVTATEEAEAAGAVYDLDGRNLVLTGDVLLTQGASAIAADRMDVDLDTGNATMQGRVRTVFRQGGN